MILAVGTDALQLPQRILGRDLFWWFTRSGLSERQPSHGWHDACVLGATWSSAPPFGSFVAQACRSGPRVDSITAEEIGFEHGPSVRAATVVWATGFRTDYSWIDVPGALDEFGEPRHQRGMTASPGLALVGMPWQHTRGSALLGFVQHDAAWVAGQLEAQRQSEAVALSACG